MHCSKTFINNGTKCLFISRYIDVMSNSSALKDLLFERKYWFTATKLMLVNLFFLTDKEFWPRGNQENWIEN